MARKFNKKTFKKKLDALWGLVIRTRDKQCLVCGNRNNLHAHHCIVTKKRSNATRWNLDNGVALCYACHIGRLHGSADESFLSDYMWKLHDKYCEVDRDKIRLLSNQVVKDNQATLEAHYERLQAELT